MKAGLFAFDLKMEDTTGVDYPRGQLITEGDEGESVAAAIAEVTEEEAGIVEDDREMEQLVEDERSVSEVGEVLNDEVPKTEHAGLTQSNARLAKLILGRVIGKQFANRKLPKMEHFASRADARDNTKFVLEGVGEALKTFWESLKAQFKKIWTKMKTWYVKTFSAAKKLNEKAVAIRSRAESSSSTIDKKQFKFAQTKLLTTGGRLKDYAALKTGLTNLANIVEKSHTVPTDKIIDAIEDVIEAKVKETKDDKETERNATIEEKVKRLMEQFTSSIETVLGDDPAKMDESDKKLLESLGGGDGGDAEIDVSGALPGDRLFVMTNLKESYTGEDKDLKALRMCRFKFVNNKFKPKEVSADAEVTTLNTSQVSEVCNIIVDASANIYEYETNWSKIDRQQETFLRKLDELSRDRIDEVKDVDEHTSKDLSKVRTAFSTATNFIKVISGMPSMVSSYAMPVFAAALNYCEGSMRNYK